MRRRDFIKQLLALGAVGNLSVLGKNVSTVGTNIPRPPLTIPPLLCPTTHEKIVLTLQQGHMRWLVAGLTPTWGINGTLLGPAVRLQRGQNVTILVDNQLPEASTLHWHGLEVPGIADGGPHATVAAGQQWRAVFKVDQPAATCWFHPHPHGRTGYQVAMGLSGLILIEDDISQSLNLPKTWGVDDIPLILQDKRLNNAGQIDYKLDAMTAAVGWFGNLMLTNGTIQPKYSAPQGWLRLRCLNACNARSLNLAASDERALYVIASDGGFLEEPIEVTTLPILPGERFEVLVKVDGTPFDLVTLPVVQMGMTLEPFNVALPVLHVQPQTQSSVKALPEQLVSLPALPTIAGLPERVLQLSMDPQLDMQGMQMLMQRYGHAAMADMDMDGHGEMDNEMFNMNEKNGAMRNQPLDIMHANMINDKPFDMKRPAFHVKQGQWEKWTISGVGDMMLHPFHIHGTQFRILSENGAKPDQYRQGWKDIVKVEGKNSVVLVRFNHLAPAERPYMAHCHLLEHEDTGMMTSFTVGA